MSPAVAHHAAAEIPPASPHARMIRRMIWPLGRRAQPEVPVQSCRHGRRFLRTPGPLAGPPRMAEGIIRQAAPGVDLGDLADGAIPNPLANKASPFRRMSLDSHLGSHAGFFCQFGQHARFVDIVRQRLLAVNVLSSSHCFGGNNRVRMVRRGNHNSVDIALLVQHLPKIGIDLRFRIPLERLGRVLVVHVAQGHDVLAFELHHIALAHAADADTGDIELLAGRDISRSSQNVLRYDSGCGGHRCPGKKTTPVYILSRHNNLS